MVTVQIFLGETKTTSKQYQKTMNEAWFAACQGSESYPVADGDENGYDFVLWQLLSGTGSRPARTIAGRDHGMDELPARGSSL